MENLDEFIDDRAREEVAFILSALGIEVSDEERRRMEVMAMCDNERLDSDYSHR